VERLLVLSCGKRKRPDRTHLAALQRYDGPAFRVVRRYLAMRPQSPPAIYILSAKFGLIPAAQQIPYYDQRLTPQRATELQPDVFKALSRIFANRTYEQIYLAVGRDYALTLNGVEALTPQTTLITYASGSQGKRLAQLHDWLHAGEMLLSSRRSPVGRVGEHCGSVQLRGVELSQTADQALTRARQALTTDSYGSDRFHSWYVLLDEERIAPKWLVGKLSGLPVSAFTTRDALRILQEIGISIQRSELV
jgi:hypothetical protein